MTARLDQAFDALAADPRGFHSGVLRIEDGAGRLVWTRSFGMARADGAAMMPDTRFHVASIAKTLTATLILQLVEEGRLALSDRFSGTGVLPDEILSRMEGFRIEQMLRHTSGLRDGMEDDLEQLGGPAPNSFLGFQMAHGGLTRGWDPFDPRAALDPDAGVLNYLFDRGILFGLLAEPGSRFHYSDSGFMLLGLLVEHLTGQTLHQAFAERIIEPLGLAQTYLAWRSDLPDVTADRAPESDVWMGAAPLFASGMSLSFDWAGGGIVTTAAELARFLRALLAGQLFREPDTLAQMLDLAVPEGLRPPRCGVGLGIFEIEAGPYLLIGHSGAPGAKMFAHRESGLVLTGTVNQLMNPANWFEPLAALAIKELT
jgi:D-alanyl-D-alanine carboxypeptidase